MRKRLIQLHAWLITRAAEARDDDRGSFMSEYGIWTGVVAVAVLGAATYFVANLRGWFDNIPTPGG